MNIYPSSSEYAHWDITADVDLGNATLEVYLEGQWRTADWVAAAVQNGSEWTRTGRIRLSGATGGAGLVITQGQRPLYRVTAGGEVIVRHSVSSVKVVA